MDQREALKLLYQAIRSRQPDSIQYDPNTLPPLPDMYSSAPVSQQPNANAFIADQSDPTGPSFGSGHDPRVSLSRKGLRINGSGPIDYDMLLKYSGDANLSANTMLGSGNLGFSADRNNGDNSYSLNYRRPLFGGNLNVNALLGPDGNRSYGIQYMKNF